MKKLLFLALIILPVMTSTAASPYIIGASATPGVTYPAKENDEISMNKAIIKFNGFYQRLLPNFQTVPQSSFSNMYELENSTTQYKSFEAILPVTYYITEFDKERRSKILDNLGELLPDLINLKGTGTEIKQHLKNQFQNRLFIRRFMNISDITKIHTDLRIFQDKKEVKISKVMLEIKLGKDLQGKEGEVLVIEAHFYHTLQFTPKQISNIKVDLVTPAFNTGSNEAYYFIPFMTGTARSWRGAIKSIYIVNPAIESSVALPYYMKYEFHNYQYNKNLIALRNHEPEKFEKIGFYAVTEGYCNCGNNQTSFIDRINIPRNLKTVGASSWHKTTERESGTCFGSSSDMIVVKWVPDFEDGAGYGLNFIKTPLTVEKESPLTLESQVTNGCNGNTPVIDFKDRFNPIWAFDFGLDSIGTIGYKQEGHFSLETAWCTNGGVGEYIEFEITQPVDYIKFHTGYERSAKDYNENNRVRMFEMQQIGGSYKRLLLFSDEHISSSYEVNIKPGKYRMYIKDIYKGTRGNLTCFSGISLSFTVDDSWLNEKYQEL